MATSKRRQELSPLERDKQLIKQLVELEEITERTELASRMGISESRVYGLARLAGVEITVDGEPLTGDERRNRARVHMQRRRAILGHLREGLTLRQIGEKLGLTKQRVHQIIASDPLLAGAKEIANDNLLPTEPESANAAKASK